MCFFMVSRRRYQLYGDWQEHSCFYFGARCTSARAKPKRALGKRLAARTVMRPAKVLMGISWETGVASGPACWIAVYGSTSSTSAIPSGTLRVNRKSDSPVGIGSGELWTSTWVRWSVNTDCISMRQHSGKAAAIWAPILACSPVPAGCRARILAASNSWWIEKRWLDERITARVGQFAGQDFYGAQHYAASFIFEPMGYALGNLFTDFESFDPPSTPAFELRVVPIRNFYVKSMVEAEDREPFAHNQSGLVPQFRGVPISVSEIGFTPGKKASSVRAFDNVESRKGYSGFYQFGASYNPGKFTSPTSATPRSGNYLLYWMASQALWRVDPKKAKGLDATFAYDWSPPDVNRNNTLLTAGLRFNEPLPLHFHNTMSLGYVRNSLSPQFLRTGGPPWKTEHGVEFNTLLDPFPMLLVQPVIQYYANVGGRAQRAVVFGFRTKVEF
jgi:porin